MQDQGVSHGEWLLGGQGQSAQRDDKEQQQDDLRRKIIDATKEGDGGKHACNSPDDVIVDSADPLHKKRPEVPIGDGQ
jgi:hypothetical protein